MRKVNDTELIKMIESGMTQRQAAEHFGVTEGAISQRVKRLKSQRPPESFERLTDKEKGFVLAKVEGKSNLEAVKASYDCTSNESAKALGTKLMKDPDISECIHDLLHQEGIGRRRRVQRLRDLIESGNMTDVGRGLDMANKMTGSYAPIEVKTDVSILVEEILRVRDEMEPWKSQGEKFLADKASQENDSVIDIQPEET